MNLPGDGRLRLLLAAVLLAATVGIGAALAGGGDDDASGTAYPSVKADSDALPPETGDPLIGGRADLRRAKRYDRKVAKRVREATSRTGADEDDPRGTTDDGDRIETSGEDRRGTREPGRKKKTPAAAGGDPIVIAVTYHDPATWDAFGNGVGGKFSSSDPVAAAKATVDRVNAGGGIAGRQVKLRLRRFSLRDGRPWDTTFEEICADLGSGDRPAAVILAGDTSGTPATLRRCLAARDLPLIRDFPTPFSRGTLAASAETLYAPGSPPLESTVQPFVRTLSDAGFFGKGNKVGLLRQYGSEFDPYDAALQQALRAAGANIVAEFSDKTGGSDRDIAGYIARSVAQVARFKLRGVNRVVVLDDSGGFAALFMRAAEPLLYRPRVGINSSSLPQFLRANVPPAQLKGVAGIGWSPMSDVADPPGSAKNECAGILGQIPGTSYAASGRYASFAICDAVLLLRDAIRKPADAASTGALRRALEAVGTRRQSALALSSNLTASSHAGATAYRPIGFSDGCSCFEYTGPQQSLP